MKGKRQRGMVAAAKGSVCVELGVGAVSRSSGRRRGEDPLSVISRGIEYTCYHGPGAGWRGSAVRALRVRPPGQPLPKSDNRRGQ